MDIGKIMEEEMVFPQPLDVVFATVVICRGICATETVVSEPGRHQAAGKSDVSLSIPGGISYL